MNAFSTLLNTRVPFVTLIVLPIPALSAGSAREGLHQFDHDHLLGLLVAELLFEAESNRGAMGDV